MANKQTNQTGPQFADLPTIEELSRHHSSPLEPLARLGIPEGERARHMARWFDAAADALHSRSLPDQDRWRINAFLEFVNDGRVYTADEKRRDIIRIVAGVHTYDLLPEQNVPDTPEEIEAYFATGTLTNQQETASRRLFFFSLFRPGDGHFLDKPQLMRAVLAWQSRGASARGFNAMRRKLGGGKYLLVARGISQTPFECTKEKVKELADELGL